MSKNLQFTIVLLCIIFKVTAQTAVTSEGTNFTSFTTKQKTVTDELQMLTDKSFYNHPEYGVLPYDAPCSDCIELLQKRDETHRYFVKNGTKGHKFSQQTSYGKINYYDENGVLRAIDPKLKPVAEQGVFKAWQQPFPVEINLSKKYTSLLNAGRELQVNRNVHIYIKHKDNSISDLGEPDWSDYTAGDDGVVIHNFYPGIDLILKTGRGSIESFYKINKPLNLQDGWLIISDNMKIPDDLTYEYSYAEKTADNMCTGTTFLVNRVGTQCFYISNPVGYDINTEGERAQLKYTIANNGLFELYVPVSWMNEPNKSYPLVIDPLVSISDSILRSNIAGPRYDPTCFQNGCSYTLNVNIPGCFTITDVFYSFGYQALGTCHLDHAAYDITYKTCRSPSNPRDFHFCNSGISGLCQAATISCYNNPPASGGNMIDCIPAPQCAPYTIPFVLTFYSCSMSANCGFSCIIAAYPWVMTIEGYTMDTLVSIHTSPDTVICLGDCVTLVASVDSGIPPYSYVWYPGGLTGNSITICPAITETVTVTATDCCVTDSALGTVRVTVLPDVSPTVSITAAPPGSICPGTNVTFTASSTYGGQNPNYQWYLNGNKVGVNSFTYSSSSLNNGDVIYVVMHSNLTCVTLDSAQSNSITIIYNPPIVPTVSITANPAGIVCVGDSVTFAAIPTNGGSSPSYQWYRSNIPVGTNSLSYSTPYLHNGDRVSVHLRNAVGPCIFPDTAVSNTITMRVDSCVGINEVFAPDALKIYPNPANDHLNIYSLFIQRGKKITACITDVLGQSIKIHEITCEAGKAEADISKLAPGIYFLSIEDGNRRWMGRFVKE